MKPVIVQVQEGSGASTESILVFIGGVLAAIAAVATALLTVKGAEKRLQQALTAERQRFDRQMEADAERIEKQFEHERYLAQRAEASSTVEQISRLVSRNIIRIVEVVRDILEDKKPRQRDLDAFTAALAELSEELNIVAVRFGHRSQVVKKMEALLQAVDKAFPSAEEAPLSEQRKEEVRECLSKINKAETEFLSAAKKSLEEY